MAQAELLLLTYHIKATTPYSILYDLINIIYLIINTLASIHPSIRLKSIIYYNILHLRPQLTGS